MIAIHENIYWYGHIWMDDGFAFSGSTYMRESCVSWLMKSVRLSCDQFAQNSSVQNVAAWCKQEYWSNLKLLSNLILMFHSSSKCLCPPLMILKTCLILSLERLFTMRMETWATGSSVRCLIVKFIKSVFIFWLCPLDWCWSLLCRLQGCGCQRWFTSGSKMFPCRRQLCWSHSEGKIHTGDTDWAWAQHSDLLCIFGI